MVQHVRISVYRDGRNIQLGVHRAAIERLYILYDVLKAQPFGVDAVGRQGVKHECVVRVGAVPKCDFSVSPYPLM